MNMQCICNEGHLFIQSTFDRSRLKREIFIQKLNYSCARSTVCKILPHVFKQCGCDNFIRSIVNISRTVLTRIISIALTPFWGSLFAPNTITRTISTVRIPFLFPGRDNTINRDDDAKRSPLNETHVADLVLSARYR